MKHISLDIETYSSVDLSKSSVYRYSEAPDFEILLFGYSVDDGPVQVVDLASGEHIPDEILTALTDERVTKWAFNANFERVCLSRYLGLQNAEFLDPAQWRCTMIWSAYLGLPLSLMGVGAALALDKQKLSEGKELIRYFCQPCAATKTNGGRTRNLPQDAPEKWALFKAYNLRDVETEMSIQQRLRRYPVPEDVWEQYHQDQEINDRGIAIDRQLVESAIQMDMRSRAELTEQKMSMLYLKSQVNPHFLYNTLDAIRIQAQLNGDDEAAHLLMRLVDFFRHSVKVNRSMVTLDDELELLEAYMELMCCRYPKLRCEYDIDPALGCMLVPNFILQPIVENSLLHGLKNKGYTGTVRISAHAAGQGKLELLVSDTGSGFAPGKKAEIDRMLENYARQAPKLEGSSIGILNVQKRIKLLCGRDCGLSYTENPDGGVTARLLLPVKEDEG